MLLTMRRKKLAKRILLDDFSNVNNILGLVSLVDISPQGQVTLGILRVAVVEVDEQFLKNRPLFIACYF